MDILRECWRSLKGQAHECANSIKAACTKCPCGCTTATGVDAYSVSDAPKTERGIDHKQRIIRRLEDEIELDRSSAIRHAVGGFLGLGLRPRNIERVLSEHGYTDDIIWKRAIYPWTKEEEDELVKSIEGRPEVINRQILEHAGVVGHIGLCEWYETETKKVGEPLDSDYSRNKIRNKILEEADKDPDSALEESTDLPEEKQHEVDPQRGSLRSDEDSTTIQTQDTISDSLDIDLNAIRRRLVTDHPPHQEVPNSNTNLSDFGLAGMLMIVFGMVLYKAIRMVKTYSRKVDTIPMHD